MFLVTFENIVILFKRCQTFVDGGRVFLTDRGGSCGRFTGRYEFYC